MALRTRKVSVAFEKWAPGLRGIGLWQSVGFFFQGIYHKPYIFVLIITRLILIITLLILIITLLILIINILILIISIYYTI